MAQLFGISGKISSGKDTLARELSTIINRQTKRSSVTMAYSDSLRKELDMIIEYIKCGGGIRETIKLDKQFKNVPFTDINKILEILYSSKGFWEKDFSVFNYRTPEVRQALQFWGTDVRRRLDNDYWVKKTIEEVNKLKEKNLNVFITDVRFPNEADAIHENNGILIRINCDEDVRLQRMLNRDNGSSNEKNILEKFNHLSETALDEYTNYHIIQDVTNQTVEETANNIINFLYELKSSFSRK